MNTFRMNKLVAALLAGSALVAIVPSASAEQTTTTGAGALSTNARLDFRIVIPRVLRFQVGSAGATIDQVTFTVPAANVGDTSDIAGDITIPVTVIGNGGPINITATSPAGMTNVAGDSISYVEILETSTDPTNFPTPDLVNGGISTAVNVAVTAGQVTNRTATWSYQYSNTNIVGAGTYGTAARGGQVTYTANMP